MKVIGIDIGSYSIKIAELNLQGRLIDINDLKVFPISQKPNVDKDLEIITVLKDALKTYEGIPKNEIRFVMGLPQDKVSVRSLIFPFKEKVKILKSLPFELEDLTPFSFDEAIFDAKIVERSATESKVIGIACPKDLIEKNLSLASDVKIDPDVISLEGFALNNLFENLYEPPPQIEAVESHEMDEEDEEDSKDTKKIISESVELEDGEAILNLGHSSSILVVRSKKSLKAVRRINWGAANVLQTVAKTYNLQPQAALAKLTASKGILLNNKSAYEEDANFSKLLSKSLSELGSVIHLTLLELKGTHKVKVRGIGLLGGFSTTPNIGPKLTEFIKIPCNRILKIKNYPELAIKENVKSEATMAIAIGLALEGCKRSTNPAINFRKAEFKKEDSSIKDLWSKWNFYVNLCAACLVAFFTYSYLRANLTEELAYQAKRNMQAAAQDVFQIKRSKVREGKLKKLLSDLSKREETKRKVLNYTKKAPSPLNVLTKISEKSFSRTSFPIDIKSFKIHKNSIEFSGRTTNRKDFKSFTEKLKKLAVGKVDSSTTPVSLEGNKSAIDFSVQFKPKQGVF